MDLGCSALLECESYTCFAWNTGKRCSSRRIPASSSTYVAPPPVSNFEPTSRHHAFAPLKQHTYNPGLGPKSQRSWSFSLSSMATHMSTIVSRKTADILTHISQLRTSLLHRPLLYTISVSQQTDSADLSQLVSSIKSLSSHSVGCLSAAIPSARSAWQQYTAVSVASFDEQHATLFRSTIPGRKAVQVGRWHALRQKDEQTDTRDYSQNVDWEGALSKSYDSDALPPALQDLPYVHTMYLICKVLTHDYDSVDDVDSIVYLSDNAPEGLTSALSKFSFASKVSIP